jgi:paraquat-inducible protein A
VSATAANSGFILCEVCEQLNRAHAGDCACARCGAELHARKANSFARSWAFLIGAAALYLPANYLPVLHTGSVWGNQSDTILSGVLHLWNTGSEPLAIIVFVASIVIPAAKILSLGFLLAMAQRRSLWNPLQRAKLYRATHWIGRWSLVDIYVGGTLVALVHLGPFADIEPGPAAIPFGLVVVLTMLSSMSFDPRTTWDPLDARHG